MWHDSDLGDIGAELGRGGEFLVECRRVRGHLEVVVRHDHANAIGAGNVAEVLEIAGGVRQFVVNQFDALGLARRGIHGDDGGLSDGQWLAAFAGIAPREQNRDAF